MLDIPMVCLLGAEAMREDDVGDAAGEGPWLYFAR